MKHIKWGTTVARLKWGSPERNAAEKEANYSGARCYLVPGDATDEDGAPVPAVIPSVAGEQTVSGPVDVPAWVGWTAISDGANVRELTHSEYLDLINAKKPKEDDAA